MSLTLPQQKHNIDFILKSLSNEIGKSSAQDLVPDLLDPHYFGNLKSNPQKSGSKGQNSNQKLQTKIFCSQKPILNCRKKKNRVIKNFLISEWFISCILVRIQVLDSHQD